MAENCVSCHSSGEIAPFALDNYDDVSGRAKWIADTIKSRQMPPSNIDNSGECNTFHNARWMSDADIIAIEKWAQGGTPRGEKNYQEPTPIRPASLDRTDAILELAEPYTPSVDVTDEYRCFIVNNPVTTTNKNLTGLEIVPGDVRSVHHVIFMQFENSTAASDGMILDDADDAPGFPCFGGVPSTKSLGVWGAGGGPLLYSEGSGFPILANIPFVVQIHYNSQNGVSPDRTRFKIKYDENVTPVDIFLMAAVGDPLLKSEKIATRTGTGIFGIGPTTLTIPNGFEIHIQAVFPHMHKLGSKIQMRFNRLEDSQETCLAKVNDWNFNWQDTFFYEKPIILTPGTYTGTTTCTFDTTKNWPKSNPNQVAWGEGSEDEMCLAFVYYTIKVTL